MAVKRIAVGGLPMPTGGVTNFVASLARNGLVDVIVDAYPHDQKIQIQAFSVSHVEVPNVFLIPIYLWRIMRSHRFDEVFFNFSNPRSAMLFFFILKRNVKFSLLLHGGLLRSGRYRLFVRLALKKIDVIYYLSIEQYRFYRSIGVKESKLARAAPFVEREYPLTDSCGITFDVLEFIHRENGPLFCASGYPDSKYRHDWSTALLKYFPSARIILCLYGEGDLKEFYANTVVSEQVMCVWNLTKEQFNYVLSKTQIYLRPNSVDSFGVGVASARRLGVEVVASDVCDRYDGAVLFSAESFRSFLRSTRAVLDGTHVGLRKGDIKRGFKFSE